MTSDSPPSGLSPEPPSAPQYRAPVQDARPRSALAIWTLVTTIVLAIGATAFGVWAAMIPAVFLGLVALRKIKPQLVRGQVMVIVALVMAVLAGSCSFMGARTVRGMVDHLGAGALGALGSEEPDRIDKWIATEAREDGASERFQNRFAAVVDAYGPYQGEAVLPSTWFGAAALMQPPTDVEEIGTVEGEAWTLRRGALWFKGVFQDAEIHVEMLLGDEMWEVIAKALEDAEKQVPSPVLRDLRFFKDKE